MARKTALVVVLRWVGAVEMTALFPMVMPHAWMAEIHDWLGVTGGPLPEIPIIHYLTRSLSAMYAMMGAVMLYLSLDVAANARVIRFLGTVIAAFGLILYGLDVTAGLPLWWILFEGTFVFCLGLTLRFLSSPPRPAEPQ